LLLLALCLVSCDALLEEILSDTGTDTELKDTVAGIDTAPNTVTEESTAKPTDPSAEDTTEDPTETPTEATTEDPTETPTEAVTYEDEFVNALVNELRAKGYDMETPLHERTASNGHDYSFSISTSPRILSAGDTLEFTVNELYYYDELQDMEYYCREFLRYNLPESERLEMLGDYELFNIRHADGGERLIPTTEDYVHWFLIIPDNAAPGAYEVVLRVYDDLIRLCYFIVH
jgi:hypothetical protein